MTDLVAHFAALAREGTGAYDSVDWDEIHPRIGDIHRGIGVTLPDDVHRIVHDRTRPRHERAQALLDHVADSDRHGYRDASGMGTHWTLHQGVAEDFAEKMARHEGGGEESRHPEHGMVPQEQEEGVYTPPPRPAPKPGTAVVFHAHAPGRDDIDEHAGDDMGVYHPFGHGEAEIPVRPGASLQLKGVSWSPMHEDDDPRRDDEPHYEHHTFPGNEEHHGQMHLWHEPGEWRSASLRTAGAVYYHGTSARLRPGEHLTPGHMGNFGVGEDKDFVHLTTDSGNAAGYADWAARRAENAKIGIYPRGFSPLDSDHDFGEPERHVYHVEPTGSVERDNSSIGSQFRTRHPVRVVREIGTHTAAAWVPKDRIFGPTYGLDHRLFGKDEKMLGPVRGALLDRLQRILNRVLGADWKSLCSISLAGSEASKWTSPELEGNNDLDVLVGVAYSYARDRNAELGRLSDAEISAALNSEFRELFNDESWTGLAGGPWHLTAYCNDQALDIRRIKPYAAYDLAGNRWVVKPPDLPGWSAASFEQGPALFGEARAVAQQIRAILRLPEPYRGEEAKALWDHLHERRSAAFSQAGRGWSDTWNVIEKYLDQTRDKLIDKLRSAVFSTTARQAARATASGSGDRWVECSRYGCEHWGAHGAAGLLIRHEGDDGQTRYLLQKRSPWVHHGDTWSTPGGAIGRDETPEHGAMREAREEFGPLPRNLAHHHTDVSTDHGDWKYHTVVMDSPEHFMPRGGGSTEDETAGAAWHTAGEIEELRHSGDLHPGFAGSWEHVHRTASKEAAWDASGSEKTGVYLRFGGWPKDERSFSPAGGYHEEGVSAYDLDKHGNPSIDEDYQPPRRMPRQGAKRYYHASDNLYEEGHELTGGHRLDDLYIADKPEVAHSYYTSGHVYEVAPHGEPVPSMKNEYTTSGARVLRRLPDSEVLDARYKAYNAPDQVAKRDQQSRRGNEHIWRTRNDRFSRWYSGSDKPSMDEIMDHYYPQGAENATPEQRERGMKGDPLPPEVHRQIYGAVRQVPSEEDSWDPYEETLEEYRSAREPEMRTPSETEEYWNPERLYHGTNARLQHGDLAEPGHEANWYGGGNMDRRRQHAYATPHPASAWNYAEKAVQEHGGEPHVYEVGRAHDMMPDPEEGLAFGGGPELVSKPAWRSKTGFPVLRELPGHELDAHGVQREGAVRQVPSRDGPDGVSRSMMVAIVPPAEVLDMLEGAMAPMSRHQAQPREKMHITLLYLGEDDDHPEGHLPKIPGLIRQWATTVDPFEVKVQGSGTFMTGDSHVLHALADIRQGSRLRVSLEDFLAGHGITFPRTYGFIPHITLAYSDARVRFLPKIEPASFPVDEIWHCHGGRWESMPLGRPAKVS